MKRLYASRFAELFPSTFDCCERAFAKISSYSFHEHRFASRLFPSRPRYLSIFLSGYILALDGGKTASRPMQSFDVSSGCLRPNVKKRKRWRARETGMSISAVGAQPELCVAGSIEDALGNWKRR